uniref:LysE family translocator n=1 Tax=Pseudoalteromonas sp. TaxID=53249 RepID=UPI003567270C
MDINIIFSFWLVSILFVLTPGADWAYTISAGIAGDKIVPAVSGLILGHLVASLIVVVGLGALLASHAIFIKLLTLFGALYIIWIAVSLYRFPPMPAAYASGQQHTSDTPLKWMRKGFIISGLNPKVMLLFLALLPQFVLPTLSFSITEQLLVLSVI